MVKKTVATKVKETTTSPVTTTATTVAKEISMNVKNDGKSNGAREIRLADMPKVKLTQAEFAKLDPKGIVDAMVDPKNPAINRIGRERAKAALIERIEAGKIKITPASLMDLTYKNVRVEGVAPAVEKKIRGVKDAEVTLTTEEFSKVTPKQIVEWVGKYTHKRRVAGTIIPTYILAGMPVTAEDVVILTNGRVEIEGVANRSTGRGGGKKAEAVTEGVEFS